MTCHMAEARSEAGGHTFEVRMRWDGAPAGINPAACASCHGGVTPEQIGAEDESFDERFEAALEDARGALAAKLNVTDACGRRAARAFDHDGTIRFVDARGNIIGDCDDNRRMNETWPDSRRLPRAVRDAAHDLLLIERDGSRGRHHPAYAFRVLLAISSAL